MKETTLLPRPIVIVTGANGGVGYGICQRLLLQLCQATPSDSRPQDFSSEIDTSNEPTEPTRFDGVTLIMACKNMKRADAARNQLLQWFDAQLKRMKRGQEGEEYVRSFREGCDVQIAELDLASFNSVLKFAATMNRTFPYVSHVVFNAGVLSFSRIDLLPCIKQILTSPIAAFTSPTYYVQNRGEVTADNLGWVWQSNVFGHFALFRELEPLLAKTSFTTARVIWPSSLSAAPDYYDSDDWQLIKTDYSYESSKYQIDLIATHFDRLAPHPSQAKTIRHFVSEPGICLTNIMQGITGPVLKFFSVVALYIIRCCGSRYHTIHPIKAAIAAVHLMLVPLVFLANNDPEQPIRYGARTNWRGHEYVATSPVKEWASHEAESAALVKKCDALYSEMKKGESSRASTGA